jgi:hypothetical protein
MAAETFFTIKNCGAIVAKLEPTSVFGEGTIFHNLVLQLSLRLSPISLETPLHYTLLRVAGKLSLANTNDTVAALDSEPMAMQSGPQAYDQRLDLKAPLTLGQIKRIEELRDGKNPCFRITLTALVMLHTTPRDFERASDAQLYVTVPRSHWIDQVLNIWNVSDLRLLEISAPRDGRKEIVLAQERLAQAENFYRTADYPQVLTELRSAFTAIAECYSCKQADQNAFGKMLVNTHPAMRERLRQSFGYFCAVLNTGPHEPPPTPEVPMPVSRQDARVALVVAHAIFEYFSSQSWPGI